VAQAFLQSALALRNKHAVVTGGSRGIGAAIARQFISYGASVTIFSRGVSSELRLGLSAEEQLRLSHLKVDVSDANGVTQAMDSAKKRAAIDILVNNAGRAASAPFLKTDDSLWRSMMDVNLEGTVHCTRAVLPGMLDSGWGRIVNVSSTAGLTGYAYVSAYCAAKHAVIGLTRALALEVATKGVTVNAVCPSYTETEMLRAAVENIVEKTGRTPDQARAKLAEKNPQGRLVQPEQVANAVLWLCLPGSEAITGQAISVSGGEVM